MSAYDGLDNTFPRPIRLTNLELLSLFPHLVASLLDPTGSYTLGEMNVAADSIVTIADVHEASTPNTYRSPR